MKKTLFSFLITFVSLLSLSNSSAQQYTRWNLPQGALARLGKGKINEIKYSPDGKVLASGSDDSTVMLWDLTQIEPKND